jgi:hypothetical protein
MRFVKTAFIAIGFTLMTASAFAASQPVLNEPATIGFGAGYYDVFKNDPHKPAADFRLEYRSSFDMLGLAKAHNSYIAIRPFGGVEVTTDGALYGLGGFVFDMPIGKHFVFSPNVGVGLYSMGDGKRLGSFVEFRSTVELGYKFDNGMRLTGALGHISNAGLDKINHGVEIATAYIHVPVNMIFSK